MIRVMVTGAAGFLGATLARRFEARDDVELIALGRAAPPPFPRAGVLDLHDRAAIADVLAEARPDVVVHAAGRTPGKPGALLADNAVATANLAEAIGEAACGAALVLLGSGAQYGVPDQLTPWKETDPCSPFEPYGLSKHAAETAAFAAARRLGFGVAALRIFNVVAPEPQGEQVFAAFLRRAAAAAAAPPPWRVEMGPLTALRDFVDIEDVLTAVERVIERGVWGEAINVCAGVGRTARALLGAAAAQTGGAVVVREEAEGAPPELAWSVGDPAKCEALLGFRPTSDLAPVTRRAAAWLVAAARRAEPGAARFRT
ncbi:MAG TPA: NAD-dependent epimerase/dehydratase family protein [Caulobacteraceae bacterium]|nr:NAD-dependent epimerase/dehydratase family protein [Caulobacteraceae bacterium]